MITKLQIFSLALLATGMNAVFADPVEVLTSLEPYRSIEINPVETGVISKILVEEGQAVTAGDILVELDTEITRARLDIAKLQAENEGSIKARSAERDLQSSKLSRLRSLKGTSRAEIYRESANLEIAEGNLMTAKMEQRSYALQVKQIEAELKRRVLTTPIDGVVTEVTKDISESVMVNQARNDEFLVQVVQLNQLKAEANVPSFAAISLKVGQELSLRVEDGKSTMVTGVIEFVSPVIKPSTSTVKIQLVIDNADGVLRSGLSGYVLVDAP